MVNSTPSRESLLPLSFWCFEGAHNQFHNQSVATGQVMVNHGEVVAYYMIDIIYIRKKNATTHEPLGAQISWLATL
jgi:hypothetical protein